MIPFVIPGTSAAFTGILIKVAIVGALVASAYVKGCSDEKERFDDYKSMVKAVGEAQEARTKTWIAQGKANKEKADATYERVVHNLLDNLDAAERRLRVANASSSIVPAAGPVAQGGDGDTVCFSQRILNDGIRGGLERALGQFAGIVRKGEKADALGKLCAAWAVDNANRPDR